MTDTEPLVLAGEFPDSTAAEWRRGVDKVLAKGRDLDESELARRFERELVTVTVDGTRIEPLYTASDAPAAGRSGVPGGVPFVRSTRSRGSGRYGWQVRQRVRVAADAEAANAVVMTELERGTTAIELDLTAVPTVTVDLLDRVLDGVYLDLVPITLRAGGHWGRALGALHDLWERRRVAPDEAAAMAGVDPIGQWAASGGIDDLDDLLAGAVGWAARHAAEFPSVRTISVDAARFHEAGAAEVDELAVSVAAGVAYLRKLTAAGMTVDEACGQLEFRYSATPDQFLTIAKLRAARRLWQRAAEVAGAGVDAQRQVQHAVTSTAAGTRYDPWVNLLRSTVECFGAGVGGADAVTVLPHDELLEPGGSELGRRLARNTQIVLIEESHLSRVVDIPGGSWYVESLTDQLAETAWDRFRAIEREGGLVASLESGSLQAHIAETSRARDRAIATRSWPLTGLSEFPDIGETPPASPALSSSAAGARFAPVVSHRWSAAFEHQRGRADEVERASGTRPGVFLACLGTAASHTARATFAKNLFEVGGIRAVASEPLTSGPEAAAAFAASGLRLVCICGSDDLYGELGVDVAAALQSVGPVRMYLAGQPKPLLDDLTAAGVEGYVRAGGDALSLVTEALDAVGAPT